MTGGFHLLQVSNRAAYRVCAVATAALLAALVVNNLLEMAARGLLHTSIGWVFEINLLIAIWLYFMGIYQVYYKRGDISVDALLRLAAPRAQRAVSIAVDIAIVGTLLVIAWYSRNLMEVQWPYKTPGLRLPNPLFTAPVFIGSILMASTMTERLILRLASPDPLPSGIHGMDA